MTQSVADYHIAVLVPCYNEEATVGRVVRDFHGAIPSAVIYCVRQQLQ